MVEIRHSDDPKVGKAFRKIEAMLDNFDAQENSVIGLINAETGRLFGVLMTPKHRQDDVQREALLIEQLENAMETIKVLEDQEALLDIIDAQNDVLQGRVVFDEAVGSQTQWTCGNKACSVRTADPSLDPLNIGTVTITDQEFEELLSLRKKRERDHKQLSSMDAKLKEYKKCINSLQSSRDTWHARADENYEMALRILNNTRRINGLAPLDLVPAPWSDGHIAFTADAIRPDEDVR